MFKRKKLAALPEEPTVGGWKLRDLHELARRLTKEEPLVRTALTGVVHGGWIDGPRFQYHLGTGVDAGRAALFRDSTEVSGRMSWPPALVHGTIGLIHDANALEERGAIGGLSITSRIGENSAEYNRPLIEFNVGFLELEALSEMRQSLLTALSGNGRAWLNFVLDPIDDAEAWVADFREKGYSRSLAVVKAYLGTAAGEDLDQ